MIAKALIVVVAFPVLGHAIFSILSIALGVILPAVLPLVGSWSELLQRGAMLVIVLIAAHTSFRVCRRLWPTPRVTV
jgi:ABC-type branched-subunit amino acid transport system permease subunit